MSAELKCRYCCTPFSIGNARRPEDVRCPFCKKPFCDAETLTRFRAREGSFGTFDCDRFELQRRSSVRFWYDVFDAKEQRIGVARSPLRVGQGCFAVVASVAAFVGVPVLFAIAVTQLGRKLGNADALGLDGPQPPLHTFAVIVLLLALGLAGAAAMVWLTRPRTRITLYADNTKQKN